MYKVIITVAVTLILCAMCLTYADPNEPAYSQPVGRTINDVPPAGESDVFKIDEKTVRVVTSEDVTESTLNSQRSRLVRKRAQLIAQVAVLDKQIAEIDRRKAILE